MSLNPENLRKASDLYTELVAYIDTYNDLTPERQNIEGDFRIHILNCAGFSLINEKTDAKSGLELARGLLAPKIQNLRQQLSDLGLYMSDLPNVAGTRSFF